MLSNRTRWCRLACLWILVGLFDSGAAWADEPAKASAAAPRVASEGHGCLGLDTSSFTSRRSLLTRGLAGLASAWIWEETDERFGLIQHALADSRFDPALASVRSTPTAW